MKNKNKFKLELQIIDHSVDKQFPSGALLVLRWKNRIYVEASDLDFQYKNGDKELTPKHLVFLFKKFTDLLEKDGYRKVWKKVKRK